VVYRVEKSKVLMEDLPKHGMSYQTTLDWKILLSNSKT
jgi:hypothetical protein